MRSRQCPAEPEDDGVDLSALVGSKQRDLNLASN